MALRGLPPPKRWGAFGPRHEGTHRPKMASARPESMARRQTGGAWRRTIGRGELPIQFARYQVRSLPAALGFKLCPT